MLTALMPVKAPTIKGKTATTPKKSAPIIVKRKRILAIWEEVEAPGRTPGIKAPLLCRFLDMESGSKVMAV